MKLALGLGASLGRRRRVLELTLRQLDARPDTRVIDVSRWVRTPPLPGGTARGWFLNGVAVLDTRLQPAAVLEVCIALERAAGRRRARHWGDRPLDLDLLLAEGVLVDTAALQLPHPAIGRRRFVLEPLLEVWPDVCDPRDGRRLADWPAARGARPVPAGRVAPRHRLRYL